MVDSNQIDLRLIKKKILIRFFLTHFDRSVIETDYKTTFSPPTPRHCYCPTSLLLVHLQDQIVRSRLMNTQSSVS